MIANIMYHEKDNPSLDLPVTQMCANRMCLCRGCELNESQVTVVLTARSMLCSPSRPIRIVVMQPFTRGKRASTVLINMLSVSNTV